MDPNTLYYTFSTIAQTLASALAVLVAFVLFRLSALDRIMEDARRSVGLFALILPEVDVWGLVREGGWAGLFESEHKDKVYQYRLRPDLRFMYDAARDAWRLRKQIKSHLTAALVVTVFDIALCFVSLALTRSTQPAVQPYPAGFVLATAALGGIICLILYVRLIGAIVRHPSG